MAQSNGKDDKVAGVLATTTYKCSSHGHKHREQEGKVTSLTLLRQTH